MSNSLNHAIDYKLCLGLFITLGVSMLVPEYIAPFFVFGLFIYFKNHFSKTKRNVLMGDLGKLFLAYMCYMVLSSIWSKTHLLSALIGLLWMGCFLGYLIVANTLNTKEKLDYAILFVITSAGVIGLISLLEFITYNLSTNTTWFDYYFPNPLYYDINDYVFSKFPVDIVNTKIESRASATFDNPLILATYLVLANPFCAYGCIHFENKKHKIISSVCLVMSLGGIISTTSRGAYIATIVSFIVMFVTSKKALKKLLPFGIISLTAVPIGLYLRYTSTTIDDFVNSTDTRFQIWESCLDMFTKNPIFGLGAGTDNIHTLLVNEYGIDRTHAHNLFIQMLVEGGIIGEIFLLAIIVLLYKNLIKIIKLQNKKYSKYSVMLMSSMVGFFIASCTEFTLQSPKELMMMFFVLGFSEATLRIAQKKVQFPAPRYEEYDDIDFEQDTNELKTLITK